MSHKIMEGRVLDSEEKATSVADSDAKEEADVVRAPVQQEQQDVQPVSEDAVERRCSCGAPSAVDHELCVACKKEAAKHLKEFLKNPAKGFMTNCTNGGPSSAPAGTCGQHFVEPETMPEPIRYWDGTQYRVQQFNEPLSPALMSLVLKRMQENFGPQFDKFLGGNANADES